MVGQAQPQWCERSGTGVHSCFIPTVGVNDIFTGVKLVRHGNQFLQLFSVDKQFLTLKEL